MKRSSIAVLALAATLHAQKDIVQTAISAGKFDTLVKAVQAADLVKTLRGKGPFTVFAPTDAAFAKINRHVLGDLLKRKNRSKLQSLLTYHVVPGALESPDVLSRNALDTANGQRLAVTVDGDAITIGGAGLVATDIACSNGVIHVIDTVLQPETGTIPAVAKSAGAFDTLLAAAKAAGLVGTLAGKGPLTVLAPTDKAFAKLPKGTIKSLLRPENRGQLASILSYHVIPGRIFANKAIAATSAKTVNGATVRFAINGGRLQVQGANIIGTDVQASNGVIHVIDKVLLPPQPKRPAGRLVVGVNTEKPSAALASQLGIDRNKSLVITKVTQRGNAERSGVKRYDVWTTVNGMPATENNLKKAKEASGFNGKVAVEFVRHGKHRTLPVTVGVEKH